MTRLHVSILISAVGLLGSAGFSQTRPVTPPITRPESVGAMNLQQVQSEYNNLYNDKLPWAPYVKAIAKRCEGLDALQSGTREHAELDTVMRRLLVVVRTLTDKGGNATGDGQRTYVAGLALSNLLKTPALGMAREAESFNKEFLSSDAFLKSSSIYRDVSVDLLKRYQQAEMPVPVAQLIALNQPGDNANMENGSDPFRDVVVAELFSRLGENRLAGDWYAKLPIEFLGAPKAADAYFAAKDFEKARDWYTLVLKESGSWEARKNALSGAAVYYPLQEANLPTVRERALQRLEDIDATTTKAK